METKNEESRRKGRAGRREKKIITRKREGRYGYKELKIDARYMPK
jgi:hypothetical protein